MLELKFTLLHPFANLWEMNSESSRITWKAPGLRITVFWFSKIDKFDQRLALHQNGLDFHYLRFNDAIRTTVAAPYKILHCCALERYYFYTDINNGSLCLFDINNGSLSLMKMISNNGSTNWASNNILEF